MPQTPDPLKGRLGRAHGQALHEFFAHYDIEIISCMYWRNRAPWRVATRECFDSFLLFPVIGHVRVTLASGRPLLTPAKYLALPDGVRHALALEKGHRRLEQVSLHCRIQDRWRRPLLARFASPLGRLLDPERWHRVLCDLVCLMNSDRELGQLRGKALVRELISDRLRNESDLSPLNRGGDPRVEHVLREMKNRLASPALSIEALAHDVLLSATQLRKLFRRETQSGPQHYLQRLRLDRAADLLRHSTLSVKQVALECGFASGNYFHLVFRKAFGVTPEQFRKREML